jgi:hypothetical protein
MKKLLIGIFLLFQISAEGLCSEYVDYHDFNKIKREFIRQLPESEQKIVKEIVFKTPNTTQLSHTRALKDDIGRNIVFINVGTIVRHELLSKALAYTYARSNNLDFLTGYIRYLAYAELMGKSILGPKEFASYYNVDLESQSRLPEHLILQFGQQVYTNMLAFIVAHEIAHHVLGHTKTSVRSSKKSRKMEKKADMWATDLLIKTKLNPSSVVFSMMMFNELDSRSIKSEKMSRHPAPLKRALYIASETLSKSDSLFQKELQTEVTAFNKELIRYIKEKIMLQSKTDLNPKLWLTIAEQGSRFAQLKVGELYSTGDQGFSYNIEKMLFWYKKAADNRSLFDYFDEADAEYRIGYSYAFMRGVTHKNDLAREYLSHSAQKKYHPGVHALKALNEKY